MTKDERSAQRRAYYQKNRVTILARHKRRRRENRDVIRERNRQYKAANPERYRETQRKSYQRHREQRLLACKLRRLARREYHVEYSRQYYRKHRDRHLASSYRNNLRRLYGITPEQHKALFAEQHGLCAICSSDIHGKRRAHLDHDHCTGRIRGLLCGKCNRALGYFDDDARRLESAITYLRRATEALVGDL